MKRRLGFVKANKDTIASMRRHPPLEGHPLYPKVRSVVNETVRWIRALDGPLLRSKLPALLPPLLNQLGRSATSVSANLAEGEGRTRSTGHYRQFLLISRGSLVESIDHFSSLQVLEDEWLPDGDGEDDKIGVAPVAEMRAKWEDLLVHFDAFLGLALDGASKACGMGTGTNENNDERVAKILKMAKNEGKLEKVTENIRPASAPAPASPKP